MGETDSNRIDPVRDQNLIDEYFNLLIKKEFHMDINFSNEYIATQNIVSKKGILVKTFSDDILTRPALRLFIQALIHKINSGALNKDQLVKGIESLRAVSSSNTGT
ncbi:MAG: hypothetical protein LBE92_20855 [Chryseobacterium sp.]|jgi:hypothetical protein|uniref:hypothetical protein n=1 Tax=Chryseobacterium sp. TaxID=1871047 RepID=UPI00281A3CA5|nr:hypothetical protein [Chryseobacterium sp.]MDR2238587.1 hypothetical protein [Chryseobacterium sp.]